MNNVVLGSRLLGTYRVIYAPHEHTDEWLVGTEQLHLLVLHPKVLLLQDARHWHGHGDPLVVLLRLLAATALAWLVRLLLWLPSRWSWGCPGRGTVLGASSDGPPRTPGRTGAKRPNIEGIANGWTDEEWVDGWAAERQLISRGHKCFGVVGGVRVSAQKYQCVHKSLLGRPSHYAH